MPTTLVSFADAEFELRFKRPLLTEGINKKKAVNTPAGIYRGFRLAPSISNLAVTVMADPTTQDHALVHVNATGEAISLRRIGGDFQLNLTQFASKTIVITVFVRYQVGANTTADIRVFELGPLDEFTGASDELIVLGTVTVPAAGVIPTADITPLHRTEAWENTSDAAIQWAPLTKNPSFEISRNGAQAPPDTRLADFWEFLASDGFLWEVEEADPNTGNRSVKLVAPAVLSTVTTARIVQYINAPTLTDRYYKLSVALRLLEAPTAGSAFIELVFRNKTGAKTTETISIDLSAPDANYRTLEEIRRVGLVDAAMLQSIAIDLQNVAWTPAGDVFRFDDISLWLETDGVQDPYTFDSAIARERHANPLILRPKDGSSFGEDGVKIEFDPAGDEGALDIDRLNDTLETHAFTPALRHRGRLLDLGSDLLGTADAAARPRILAPYQDNPATATYTTLIESLGVGLLGKPASRLLVEEDGNLTLTFNADWNPSTSLWNQDDAGSTSKLLQLLDDEVRLVHKDSAAAPWVDAGWDVELLSFLDADKLRVLDSLLTLDATLQELSFDAGTLFVGGIAPRHVRFFGTGVEFDETDEVIRAFGSFVWDGVNEEFFLGSPLGTLLGVEPTLLSFASGFFEADVFDNTTNLNSGDVFFDSNAQVFAAFAGRFRYDDTADVFRLFGTTLGNSAVYLDNAAEVLSIFGGGDVGDGLTLDKTDFFEVLGNGSANLSSGLRVDISVDQISWLGAFQYAKDGTAISGDADPLMRPFFGLSDGRLDLGSGLSRAIVNRVEATTVRANSLLKSNGTDPVVVRYRPVEFRPVKGGGTDGKPSAADMREQWSKATGWQGGTGTTNIWGVFGLDLGRKPTAVRFRGRFLQEVSPATNDTYRVLMGTRNNPEAFDEFTFTMDGVLLSNEFDFAIDVEFDEPPGGTGILDDERNWVMCVELSDSGLNPIRVEEIAIDFEYANYNDAIGEAGARY